MADKIGLFKGCLLAYACHIYATRFLKGHFHPRNMIHSIPSQEDCNAIASRLSAHHGPVELFRAYDAEVATIIGSKPSAHPRAVELILQKHAAIAKALEGAETIKH